MSDSHGTQSYMLLRQTKPFPVNGPKIVSISQTIPGQIQFSDDMQIKPLNIFQADAEETLLTSRSAGSFLPGVSTRPRYPAGYTQPAPARQVQTGEQPTAGGGGPRTVLYIF